MSMVFTREHQLTVLFLKEERLEVFTKALNEVANELNLKIKGFEHRNNQVKFLLCGSSDVIQLFLDGFALQWHVREMGVSKFARVMEISDDEAKEWYEQIGKYQGIVMGKSSFESQMVSKFMKIQDIAKLEYLKKHFMDTIEELIQTRIDTLEGKEDDFTLYFKRQAEKQELLNLLEGNPGTMDEKIKDRIIQFLQNS